MSGVLKTVRCQQRTQKLRGALFAGWEWSKRADNVTPRQGEVLKAIWRTGTVKQAASELNVSVKTIEVSTAAMRYRLGFPGGSLIDLMRWGIRHGWLTLLLLLWSLNAFAVQPRPIARFTTGPTTGYAPLTVNFTNTTTGQVQSQTMSFGTGAYLLTNWKTTTYHYNEAGSFNATLTVKGKAGYTSYSTLIIVTNKPATASVTLAWTPSTSTNVVFYTVASGFSSHNYSVLENTTNTNSYMVTNLIHGTTYYFNVDCTDKYGLESEFDGEVSYTP